VGGSESSCTLTGSRTRLPARGNTMRTGLIAASTCLAVLLALGPALPAPAAAAGQPWLGQGKVRCLSYLDTSDLMVRSVGRVREMGFNCALVQVGGRPLSELAPLIQAADRAGMRLIMVTSLGIGEYLRQAGASRPFVGPDGVRQPATPCPLDEAFWRGSVGKLALSLAELQRAGHTSVAGLLFDKEDYDHPISHLFCHCDYCFGAFLQSLGKNDLSVLPPERNEWLTHGGLWDRYCAFQDEAATGIFARIRADVDRLAPGLVLATYPWAYQPPTRRHSRVDWDLRFVRGLGSEQAPFLLLDEATYVWGHGPALERQRAEYQGLGLHFRAITGFNVVPAERVWYPEQMAASAYWACRRGDGYWIFLGHAPLLTSAAGQHAEWLGVFGGRPQEWIEQFGRVNRAVAQGKAMQTPPLELPPMADHWEVSDLFGPRCSPGASWQARRWTDIGLPWEGGELVLVARRPGDWLSFRRPLNYADRFRVLLWLTTGPDRGIVQAYADDQPVGEPVDLYAPVTTPGDELAVGMVDLERGEHVWRLQVVGKQAQSSGYSVGLRAFSVEDVGYHPPSWQVIGPFDSGGEQMPGYDTAYPPEREINLAATYQGKRGEPVRWRQVEVQPNGYLNLLELYSEPKEAVAYGLIWVYSPNDGPRAVMLGSDDGGKLLVNGEMVWGEATARAAIPGQNEPRANLRQGWNTMLFKIVQVRGEWGFYLRLDDPKHELRYSPLPPQGQ